MIRHGRPFYKMSGSGNDFVMVDARAEVPGRLSEPRVVQAICARRTGVGADGIVFLERTPAGAVRLTYLNADGSPAALCGNATLCTARLAVELGMTRAGEFTVETDSGIVKARMLTDVPEIDLQPVDDVQLDVRSISRQVGEERIGYVLVGVPHLVVLAKEVGDVDVVGRGRPLRRHPSMPLGANVNFVTVAGAGRARMRTYERGVEAETLACGTGAVASAILLNSWGLTDIPVAVETRSGRTLTVSMRRDGSRWLPSLAGEARIVYEGRLAEIW